MRSPSEKQFPISTGVEMSNRIERTANDCFKLLKAAHEWGEKKGFYFHRRSWLPWLRGERSWITDCPQYNQLRRIGESLHKDGDLKLMEAVAQEVSRRFFVSGLEGGSVISHFWEGIGDWRP
jgi:hypothetical protein